MDQLVATFPNETYLNGLRDADASVIDALYNEFRGSISKSVEAAGGSYADANTFFRVAVIQASSLVKAGKYPGDTPIGIYLQNLAVLQYTDWLKEKGQEKTEPVAEGTLVEDSGYPGDTDLKLMRQMIRAKRQFTKLSVEDQRQILGLANQTTLAEVDVESVDITAYQPSIDRYKNLLGEQGKIWETPLPSWIILPLVDQHFHQVWSACEALERRLYSSQIPASNENKTIRNAFILFLLLTIGYGVFTWIFRDRTPAEVYDQNFQPPVSIMEDMTARYAKDSVAMVWPEACTIAFEEADAYYKKKEWRQAASALAVMVGDTLDPCKSDAFFYLSIIGLQLDQPDLTLECISKIEDLDRFGEDIYWYMALAYVKMAAIDPSEKAIAKRAVERALSNTEIPERRKQAEKMLEELAE